MSEPQPPPERPQPLLGRRLINTAARVLLPDIIFDIGSKDRSSMDVEAIKAAGDMFQLAGVAFTALTGLPGLAIYGAGKAVRLMAHVVDRYDRFN